MDLIKLSLAVSAHETADCTKGSGITHNNCVGIMYQGKDGKYRFKRYKTKEDSLKAFRYLWKNYYGNRLPTLPDAIRYSGGDRENAWLTNVLFYYENN